MSATADPGGGRRLVAYAHSKRTDGDPTIAKVGAAGYEVIDVVVRRTLVRELDARAPDVVVIDDALGDFDVVRVCHDVRRSVGSRILVLLSDERVGDEAWVVRAIEAGADDVAPRSMSAQLLRTHLLALLRTAGPRRPPNNVTLGDVVVDVDGYSVFISGRLVRFPKLQFDLLLALARRPNQVVAIDRLLSEVWSIEPTGEGPRRVRVAVSGLRKLLGNGSHRPRVETVQRVGYRLVVPDHEDR
jgi:two-component system response regulator MtrA